MYDKRQDGGKGRGPGDCREHQPLALRGEESFLESVIRGLIVEELIPEEEEKGVPGGGHSIRKGKGQKTA